MASTINSGVKSCNTLQTINGLGVALNSRSNKLKNSINDDKRVEVRWLDSEADLYIKQWQRRYRQLEGVDHNLHSRPWIRSNLLEHYDDWYLTARSILDIDVDYMNSKDFNKFNLENYNDNFDFLMNRGNSQFMFNIENAFDDDELELDDEFMPFETISLDPNVEYNPDLIAALKSNNLILKNGKLEYCCKKGKNLDKDKSGTDKQTKKNQKGNSDTTANAILSESSNLSDISPNKCSAKTPRVKSNKPRSRPPSTRRQMYICEYPGCSYQSDRNFNFLRHKRTHGKQKNDENKKHQSCMSSNNSEHIYGPRKVSNLNEASFNTAIELNSINGDILHLNSQLPLMSNELNLSLIQCNSTNISESDHSFSLNNDDYLERQNIIMKDINNLDHVLVDNHFSTLTLDQSFMP